MVSQAATQESGVNADYEIQIAGQLDKRWSDWFAGTEVAVEYFDDRPPLTTLHCPALDQARLRGMLNRAWDLNLEVVMVRRLQDSSTMEHPPTGSDEVMLADQGG